MEEIVDVVDKQDPKIGTGTRKEVHSSGARHQRFSPWAYEILRSYLNLPSRVEEITVYER
ncbi:MAG TPA: hypothetical protein VLY65_00720 [Nitrososphaerales archaeon]|nr:hypothetical protein [Nitrososphaerales archaeon]